MKKHYVTILILLVALATPVFAQLEYTFTQFYHETIDFVVQPAKWGGDDYLKLGLICAATGVSMLADEPIQRAVQRDGKFYKAGDVIPENNGVGGFIEGSQKQYFSVPVVAGRMYGELYSPCVFFAGFSNLRSKKSKPCNSNITVFVLAS